ENEKAFAREAISRMRQEIEVQASSSFVFNPSVKPGQIVSVVIPSINPKQGVYEWSASFYPESPSLPPSQTLGPVLRLDIYRSNIRF
ncbi:hypothetical protein OAE41_00395, partial [bacterium]|nr:hypothetical protein [bacterium]